MVKFATGSEGYDTEIEDYERVKAVVGVMVTVKTHELRSILDWYQTLSGSC